MKPKEVPFKKYTCVFYRYYCFATCYFVTVMEICKRSYVWGTNTQSLRSNECLSKIPNMIILITSKIQTSLFTIYCQSQWPSRSRRGSTAARLLGFRVLVTLGAWMLCVLSSTGICDGPIPRPEESYRLWCVTVCDLEASIMRRPWPALGCYARNRLYTNNNNNNNNNAKQCRRNLPSPSPEAQPFHAQGQSA